MTAAGGRYAELQSQVAVVTGAARGIGAGIAARLAAEGMHVVAADRDRVALDRTVDQLNDQGATVLGVVGDLSHGTDIDRLFEDAVSRFDTVDLLVNNAADLQRSSLLEEHRALLDLQLATNIGGPYLCAQRAAGIMERNGGGGIVNISSVGAIRAHHRGLPYDVTKGAVNAMTRAMAVDLGEAGIRVNAIGPGVTKTYRSKTENGSDRAVAERIPLRRAGTIDDIASAVAFLASNQASYITGQVLYVDGGITAQLSPPGPNAF